MRRAARAIIIRDNKSLLLMHRNKFGLEYDVLIGGGVEIDESAEQAVLREISEETGIVVTTPRPVFIEHANPPYGDQYIFVCEYVSGEPALNDQSEEFKINLMGLNKYQPIWRTYQEFETIDFLSKPLKQAIINGIKNGFPDQVIDITSN